MANLKSHCPRGHPYRYSGKTRPRWYYCSVCQTERNKAQYNRSRQEDKEFAHYMRIAKGPRSPEGSYLRLMDSGDIKGLLEFLWQSSERGLDDNLPATIIVGL